MSQTFSKSSVLPASAARAFSWHAHDKTFERLSPPWDAFEILEKSGGIETGATLAFKVKPFGPIGLTWRARHTAYEESRLFRDEQVSGPFSKWVHSHRFEPIDEGRCRLTDEIEYAPPLGFLGQLVAGWQVRSMLRRTFEYRHRLTRDDLEDHDDGGPPLTIAISGSSGLIGRNLAAYMGMGGHTIKRLVRDGSQLNEDDAIIWSPSEGVLAPDQLEGLDAVVHLAAASIDGRRWSPAYKQTLRDSRIGPTQRLGEQLAALKNPPKVFLCASAVGFYGHRGDEALDESSTKGAGFLSDLCADWEAALAPARDAGIRCHSLRFGVVLSAAGGALAKMLTPFKLGLGGPMGSGRQYLSWVAIDDALNAVRHILRTPDLPPIVNIVAPQAQTNREFSKTLGKALFRPAIAPMPGFVARALFGEVADELLLGGARVLPKALEDSGFRFRQPRLLEALKYLLGRPPFPERRPEA